MNRILLLTLSLMVLLTSACKRKTDDRYLNDPSRGYFPVRIGHFVVYNVDSTIWNDYDCTKTLKHYQIRSTIADTFTDNQGRLSYRIENMIRNNDTLPWRFSNVHFMTPTTAGIEYVENNLRFIKLAFPITEGNSWNGNSMIATNDPDLSYFQGWLYKYHNYATNYSIDSVSFANTVTVTEVDEKQNNPVTMPTAYAYRTFSKEVYVYDLGLGFKELTHWIYDPTGPTPCIKGYSVVMRAIDHN